MADPEMRVSVQRRVEHPAKPELVTSYSAHGWELRLRDPFEVRMGNYGWRLSLFHDDVDVTAQHLHLWKVEAGYGLNLPDRYQPWCSSRPIIALNAWETVVRLYDVLGRRETVHAVGFPREIQWSPRGERLAVTLSDQVTVIDVMSGAAVATSEPCAREAHPRAFWWPDGERLLVVNRPSPTSASQLLLVDALDGRTLRRADFDPAELLPYDVEAYRAIPRTDWSLLIRCDAGYGRLWGTLLDTWDRIEFDPQKQRLLAVAYRPLGACEKDANGRASCVVEQRGVEVSVNL